MSSILRELSHPQQPPQTPQHAHSEKKISPAALERCQKEQVEHLLLNRLIQQLDVPELNALASTATPATPVKSTPSKSAASGAFAPMTPSTMSRITASASRLFGIEKITRRFFGSPLASVAAQGMPLVLESMMEFLSEHLDEEGIFRRSGVASRIKVLMKVMEECYNDNLPLELHSAAWLKSYGLDVLNVHDVTGAFKAFFQQLPEPVLTFRLFVYIEQIAKQFESLSIQRRTYALQIVCALLHPSHATVLHSLLSFLKKVASHSDSNKMQISNLAKMFEPNLLRSSDDDFIQPGSSINITNRVDAIERSERRARLVEFLIEQHEVLFETPDELKNEIDQVKQNVEQHNGDYVPAPTAVFAVMSDSQTAVKTRIESTNQEMDKLLDLILNNPNLSEKEKKKMFKRHEKARKQQQLQDQEN
ncbi:hypothetical protein CAOG_04238 [Capsaspora owczarzaki ATCC 30864]|uniref:Rho-GAP domain-containing protein n=1 Tax=Capsaspora owczarzaki (strain ATCC 30864) TaxID=595528 RepID=A0A0D2UE92_CAPO3|nr:hypothetical protein CAOG_04238 [Capsaspora owczarzaki ATCC 30864]KJE93446.1 hypothetical protein CAOG_004238 [Capsaspora owczarzaki ATCC 30864]|eukprot:XP_004348063.1 hypothetical protein CAOG_04238 [Capsaspora owczarzaki ATCC 30864]